MPTKLKTAPIKLDFEYVRELPLPEDDEAPWLPAHTPGEVRTAICPDNKGVLSLFGAVKGSTVSVLPKKIDLKDCERTISELVRILHAEPEELCASTTAPNGIEVSLTRNDMVPGHFEVDLYVRVAYGLTGFAESPPPAPVKKGSPR